MGESNEKSPVFKIPIGDHRICVRFGKEDDIDMKKTVRDILLKGYIERLENEMDEGEKM